MNTQSNTRTAARTLFLTGLCSGLAAAAITGGAFATPQPFGGNGTAVPFTFAAGTPARASEVNANFDALLTKIDDLEAQLADVRSKTDFITLDTNDVAGLSGPNLIIESANLHVRSGSGATDDGGNLTGLGNLVIGYSEIGALASADRSGAHNLVMGSRNAFTSFGGIVAGTDNRTSADFASVLGGGFGNASGVNSIVVGGGGPTDNLFNIASGDFSMACGGLRNMATGNQATAVGGSNNEATAFVSTVVGGTSNTASEAGATVSGGAGNTASGANASISGGQGGTASGVSSSIFGGLNRTVANNFDCTGCE